MKTAISVPDATYRRVVEKAEQLGMSRSEFFSRAAASYLDELDDDGVTAQIDAIVDVHPPDGSSTAAVARGRRTLGRGEDW